jgi:hypothetical protein
MKNPFVSTLAGVVLLGALAGNAVAAGSASFSLSPASGTHAQNTNFTVSVMENGSNVNAVTAKLAFDASKLKCVSIGGSAAFANTVVASCGNGTATISRYTAFDGDGNPTTVSGNQSVGTVTFTALSTGTASVSFAAGSQIASSGNNIWDGGTNGGTYTITAPAATPAPTATPVVPGGGTSGGGSTSTPRPKTSATPAPTVGAVAGQSATPTATPAASATPAATGQTQVKSAQGLNKNWLWLPILAVLAAAAVAVRRMRQLPAVVPAPAKAKAKAKAKAAPKKAKPKTTK